MNVQCLPCSKYVIRFWDNWLAQSETKINIKSKNNDSGTVRVENFEVVLISRFSWVADDTKIIHVEGGINTREIF